MPANPSGPGHRGRPSLSWPLLLAALGATGCAVLGRGDEGAPRLLQAGRALVRSVEAWQAGSLAEAELRQAIWEYTTTSQAAGRHLLDTSDPYSDKAVLDAAGDVLAQCADFANEASLAASNVSWGRAGLPAAKARCLSALDSLALALEAP